MLRAEPLLKLQLLMLASEAQDAALALARFGVFNPAPCELDTLTESPAVAYREAWLEAGARLAKLLEQCGDTGPLEIPEEAEAPTLADLEELNGWLKDVWTACLACHESEAQITDEGSHLDALEESGKVGSLALFGATAATECSPFARRERSAIPVKQVYVRYRSIPLDVGAFLIIRSPIPQILGRDGSEGQPIASQ